MANYEATKYDFDGANLTDIEGIPTATIIPWSDSSVPSGYLECNGQAGPPFFFNRTNIFLISESDNKPSAGLIPIPSCEAIKLR